MIGCAAMMIVLASSPVVEAAAKEPLRARAFQLHRYSAEAAVTKLRRALESGPDIRISWDRDSNQVFVQTTAATFQQVEAILGRLDYQPSVVRSCLRFVCLKHVPAGFARCVAIFYVSLLSRIDGDDDPIYLTANPRVNGIVLAGTRDRERQVEFFLHLLDRNLSALCRDGLDYTNR